MSASSCSTTGSAGQVLDLEHVDEPVELLGHLLDGEVVAAQRDGHAADVGPLGVADRERLDVEVARAHEARDAVEDAGPVVDDDHQRRGDAVSPVPGT